MFRRYYVAPEDIPTGTYIPIDNNPNVIEQITCDGCGVVIGDDTDEQGHNPATDATLQYTFYPSGGHRRSSNLYLHIGCKNTLTITELERRIVEGTIR